ncbi:MAG: TIGR02679 domain-containing protein [Hominisplanchenecus sp.]
MKQQWNKEPQNLPDRECVEYFREKPVFDRLLRGFREKYLSYGSFSGTVILRSLKREEIEILEGFFGKSFHGKKSASISAAAFAKALKSSRFGRTEPKELLEQYFLEEMTGKREQRQQEEKRWRDLLAQMRECCAGTLAEAWVLELQAGEESQKEAECPGREESQKEAEYLERAEAQKEKECLERAESQKEKERLERDESPEGTGASESPRKNSTEMTNKTVWNTYLKKRYREAGESMEEVQRLLTLAVKIINSFPYRQGTQEYLAVFAAMITGNPHAFDEGSREGQLLYLLIQWDAAQRHIRMEDSRLFSSLQKQRLYLMAGILRDDTSNYAMLFGIRAWKKDGSLHEGMEGFFREADMVQVPLRVIAGWGRVECPEGTVYIVENPSVYAMLCGKWRHRRAVMCMNGQPRLSSLLVLDLLAEAGVKVYYAGDFDPEGLLIAQKLRQYYPGEFCYWEMSPEVYEESLSEEAISEKRMKMLENLTDEELRKIAEVMKQTGKAGYQENVWERYDMKQKSPGECVLACWGEGQYEKKEQKSFGSGMITRRDF